MRHSKGMTTGNVWPICYFSSLAFKKIHCNLPHTNDIKSASFFVVFVVVVWVFFFKGKLEVKGVYYYNSASDAEEDDIKHLPAVLVSYLQCEGYKYFRFSPLWNEALIPLHLEGTPHFLFLSQKHQHAWKCLAVVDLRHIWQHYSLLSTGDTEIKIKFQYFTPSQDIRLGIC